MQNQLSNRRTIVEFPSPVLGSLRWPNRPYIPEGNPCWTFMVKGQTAQFAVLVGHVENDRPHPFEVWVAGSEQPRCLGAVAKTLSADMRTQDRVWLNLKLEVLAMVSDGKSIPIKLGSSEIITSSYSAALARVIQYRLAQLGVQDADQGEPTPLVDAMTRIRYDCEGTMSWTSRMCHSSSGDDFTLVMPEIETTDGRQRPISVSFTGRYPRDLDALAALLTLDMSIVDVAWVAMKLRKLLDYEEPMSSFFAKTPGTGRTEQYPSIVAYLARLIVYRYASLGWLTDAGFPVAQLGVMVSEKATTDHHVSEAA